MRLSAEYSVVDLPLPVGPVTVMVHMASVWVPFDAEAIRNSPRAKGDLKQAGELELLAHYRMAGPAGRAAELADRAADEPSAVAA